METKAFPVIDPVATGDNIRRLREERGMSVKDLQRFFGFEEPRAVYKWQKGETLPSVDNLYALGILLGVPLEAILIPRKKHGPAYKEQQENSCCSAFFSAVSGTADDGFLNQLLPSASFARRIAVRTASAVFDHADRGDVSKMKRSDYN